MHKEIEKPNVMMFPEAESAVEAFLTIKSKKEQEQDFLFLRAKCFFYSK